MTIEIAAAVLIACMATTLFFTVKSNLRIQKELTSAENELGKIRNQMDILESKYTEAIRDSSWLRGLRMAQNNQKQTEEDDLK